MDIVKFVLALGEQYPEALGSGSEMILRTIERYQGDVSDTAEYVATLFENRAGLARIRQKRCDELRLGNPRLRTTYPDERRRALTKRMLDYAEVLANGLGPIVEAAIKFELSKVELAEERHRDRQFEDAEEARRELGVYVEVVDMCPKPRGRSRSRSNVANECAVCSCERQFRPRCRHSVRVRRFPEPDVHSLSRMPVLGARLRPLNGMRW